MMNCKARLIGFLFHDWQRITLHPPLVSDGAGGCWAGHRFEFCRACGRFDSMGIYAAEDNGLGKQWMRMRAARPEEIEEAMEYVAERMAKP